MMKPQRVRRLLWAAPLMTTLAFACSGEDAADDDGATPTRDAGETQTRDAGEEPPRDAGVIRDAGEEPARDGGSSPTFPMLPNALSVTGCEAFPIGPLCSVVQDEDTFDANCGGVHFDGTVTVDGDITMTRPTFTNDMGDEVETSCVGRLQGPRVTATCEQTVTPSGGTPVTEQCALISKTSMLPAVECMEAPPEFTNVVICTEGAGAGGTTIQAGACSVIQDGCTFQADCADDLTLVGSVGADGLSFSSELIALADAEVRNKGDTPAFLQGDVVAHNCSAQPSGTTLVGECGAGSAGRGGTNTSVCSISGGAAAVPQCGQVSSSSVGEALFALDSCDILKNGEGGVPGIGEPVCAFRQNNCVWEVNCGSPFLTFSGRLEPGESALEWRLATGTPCTIEFDENGNPSGNCTVPGQPPCNLGSLTPVPGGAECPAPAEGRSFTGRGCGDRGGTALECRQVMQHGCNFGAICSFTGRFPSVVIAGETSYSTGSRGRIDFNGLANWQCYVDQATDAEITSGDREANEWYGQCVTPEGGMCRDNYDPKTGSGFRGLQIFFDELN